MLFKYANYVPLIAPLLLKDNAIHKEAYFSQVIVLQDWCQAS